MSVIAVVRFAAVLTTGLLAGIFLGDRMGASFARPALPPSSFVRFQQIQHVHFAKMMPILLGIAILSSAVWLVMTRSRLGSQNFVFLVLAALALVSIVVLTRAVNAPINVLLMTWNPSSPPPDVMATWSRWEHVHTVRTCLAIVGFGFALMAFGASRNVPAA